MNLNSKMYEFGDISPFWGLLWDVPQTHRGQHSLSSAAGNHETAAFSTMGT